MALRRKQQQVAERKTSDLDALVASGPEGAYEALQLYKSKANRAKAKGDFQASLKASSDGAKLLLSKGYVTAGAELTGLLIDLFDDANVDVDAETRHLVGEIQALFPKTDRERLAFLQGILKLTIKYGTRELGDSVIHLYIASCLSDIAGNSFDKLAIYHYAVGEQPGHLITKIMEAYPQPGQQLERDRLLTVSICHFLGIENLRDAIELLNLYNKEHKLKGWALTGDLVVFCDYLLQVCRRDAQPLFKTLVNHYASQLDFDDCVPALLTGSIGEKLFGIPPKADVMSILSSFLK